MDKEKKESNLCNLLYQVFPEIENDGYLLHNTMKFFGLASVCITQIEKDEYTKKHDDLVAILQNLVLLDALVKDRFNHVKL